MNDKKGVDDKKKQEQFNQFVKDTTDLIHVLYKRFKVLHEEIKKQKADIREIKANIQHLRFRR